MKIGIIGAMSIEVAALKNMMKNAKIETYSTVDYYSGVIEGVEVVVAVAGVGKVNAAVCTQTMILTYKPNVIINIGVAGGLDKEFNIGDIAVATSVVEHDMDTSPLGDEVGFISGLNMVNIECDKEISDTMYKAVNCIGKIKAKKGVIASGDRFVATDNERHRIVNNFNAIAAEMEGASVGHVCKMNNVRFGVMRAISDGANNDAPMDYPAFAKMAAENSVKITVEMLKAFKEL